MLVSIAIGLTISSINIINLFEVIPRILLFMYSIFVANYLMPAALLINTGDIDDSGAKSSVYNKVPNVENQSNKSAFTNSTFKEE